MLPRNLPIVNPFIRPISIKTIVPKLIRILKHIAYPQRRVQIAVAAPQNAVKNGDGVPRRERCQCPAGVPLVGG